MSDYSIVNEFTGKLTHACQIILYIEDRGSIITDDVRELLYCRRTYASHVLGRLWRRGLLKRKREAIGRTHRYRYFLTKFGEKKCSIIHEKGY